MSGVSCCGNGVKPRGLTGKDVPDMESSNLSEQSGSYSVLSDLADLNNEAFCKVFVDNLDVVFQYTKSDIQKVATKGMDTLVLVQEALCEKVKSLFPMYSSRRPKKRQVA